MKDKTTGNSMGWAFVSYATEMEATNAIETLDRKLQLYGATNPLEVWATVLEGSVNSSLTWMCWKSICNSKALPFTIIRCIQVLKH